jgi:hypothetical protein
VPLKRLKDEYLEQDGVRFLMEDEAGNTVACRWPLELAKQSRRGCRNYGSRSGQAPPGYRIPWLRHEGSNRRPFQHQGIESGGAGTVLQLIKYLPAMEVTKRLMLSGCCRRLSIEITGGRAIEDLWRRGS